jgi:ABC-type multidrug transport system fused ATPase/permease subunit
MTAKTQQIRQTLLRSQRVLPSFRAILRPRRNVLLFSLLLILINRAAVFVLPYSTKLIIDNVIPHHQFAEMYRILAIVLTATAVQIATAYTTTQMLSKAAWRLVTDLRIQVQHHIGRLPVSFYDANRSGTLVSRVMADVEGIRNLVGTGLIEFFGGLVTACIALVLLLRISVVITTVTLGLMAIFALVQRSIFAITRPIARQRGAIQAEVTGRLTETMNGIRVVKSYRAEDREAQVFSAGARRLLDNFLQAISKTSITTMASTAVVGLIAASIMFLGTRAIFDGSLTVGRYVYLTMLLAFMVSPVTQIVAVGTQITEALAGLDRTREILSVPQEDDDPERVRDITASAVKGSIRFQDVSFSYVSDKPVLHNISFEARPGTVTALVGSSGSGKSTITGIVSAFYKPDSGRVMLDDIDLGTVTLDSFRRMLGVVLQESFLFEGTIRENVGFSRPEATAEEILQAARIARVDEFALRLPEGFETIVGERGVKLSGGQRQRVSIARAILANPRILILDEATSSLDSESEALIQEGLSYLLEGRTTFVIAHRLSTIRRADQILVIEQGRIVEQGNHEELYAMKGRYYDLYTRQHTLESNLFLAPGEGEGNRIPSSSDSRLENLV